MNNTRTVIAALLAPILTVFAVVRPGLAQPPAPPQPAATGGDACVPPNQMASTPEETAWRLFVAATCAVNADKYPFVRWETWIEQGQLFTSSGKLKMLRAGERPRFHMSPLAKILQEQRRNRGFIKPNLLSAAGEEDCKAKTWSHRTICEEARLNPEVQQYITAEGLSTQNGEIAFVKAGRSFQFSKPAVEIKADWIKLASCSNPPQGVHVEKVDNACYALGGLHLISKLIDKWVWATFEPQNTTTNPQRCVVLGCKDPWGSAPANSTGADTQLTQSLADLMTQANLASEWRNYRLDGVQVDFLDSNGKPTVLGNSIIEGDNAGNPTLMKSSSCISCHNLSAINDKGQQPRIEFKIGQTSPPAGFAERDFVWAFLLAH